MGKIRVKLRESYPGEFLTTVAGWIVRKTEYTEVDDTNPEIRSLLSQGHAFEVEGEETMKEKIIIDDVPKKTIKGTVTTKSLEENKATIEKIKKEQTDDSHKHSPDDNQL